MYAALGGDKEARAGELLRGFAVGFPGATLLRTVGRQSPGEPGARWSLGLLARRSDALWDGPPDPLLIQGTSSAPPDLSTLRQALLQAFTVRGWGVFPLDSHQSPNIRLLCRNDGRTPLLEELAAESLHRPSIHRIPIPRTGLRDRLAEGGDYLILLRTLIIGVDVWAAVELPALTDTDLYLTLLEAVAEGARAAELPSLVLCGHPPPVDRHLHWSSITPDPAVIEANLAPAANLTELFRINQALFAAAADCGLTPYRLHYNGRESDSGGGGQLTIGGPTPDASPFFREPHLLPRLIRSFNHHPALSRASAHKCTVQQRDRAS